MVATCENVKNMFLFCLQLVDEQFNVEETKFKMLDSAVKNVARDISLYMEQFNVRYFTAAVAVASTLHCDNWLIIRSTEICISPPVDGGT